MPLKRKINQNILKASLFALTLGLAPFNPPHIVGKLEWILGGGNGMGSMDYFDLVLHGSPWILLLYLLVMKLVKTTFKKSNQD
jgi:hypothetical protein